MLGLEFLKVFAEAEETASHDSQRRPAPAVDTAAKIVQSWEETTHDSSVPGKSEQVWKDNEAKLSTMSNV